MSVYDGWQDDLLTVAHLPKTAHNREFLTDWHQHAETDCALNPIDLSATNSGSHHCKDAGRVGVSYQRYDRSVWTRTAFAKQIEGSHYAALKAALESGNPYTATDSAAVAEALGYWQSFAFSNAYLAKAAASTPTGKLSAPHALGGWKALRKSINRGMPQALSYAHTHNRQALRTLSRARKVKV